MKDFDTIQVTILATSDIHGHLMPIRYVDNEATDYGLLKLATRIDQTRQEKEHVLVIDNGDLLQGTPFAYYHACLDQSTSHPIVDIMNQIRLDAFIPGNHEFNYGLRFINRAWGQSDYPWLSANVLSQETNEPYFGCPYRIFTLPGGAKMGLLGLTTSYIPHWEQPANISGLLFDSVVSAAKKWVPYLKQNEGADIIIVSYHGGFERDILTGEPNEEQTGENEGWRLCHEVEGIDVLLTGHQHQRIEGVRIGNTLVVQPGYQGACLAQVDLSLQRDGHGAWFLMDSHARLQEAQEMQADPALVARIQSCENNTQSWLDQPLCEVRGEMLVIDHMKARLEEHPLIELINLIQMEASNAEISCTSLFDNLAPGFGPQVSMREVTANYPFPNTLKVLRLSGRDIREALEWTAAYFDCTDDGTIIVNPSYLYPKPQHYNYDMWEGIEYVINVSRPIGSRIEELRYKRQPIDPEGEFEVVMNHYRASGGGNYRMFRDKPIVREVTVDMTEMIAEYLTKQGLVHARANGNWKVYS
ncbi:bifunctional UDP-sugar hydrolase/5'-nucleotidase [Cohnella sp. WQ 127256]|uniref:bifunctional metallophosphatase/5'-nucleotidase n=1 Tax=Cohnella sp. WQ 127256 TaxID=2938790 RepID=UPI002117896C|nr:bifunctional UDP-sugar hydrolase/5'-nucleotidase [Cohnella sp. WQ 127256]